MNYTNSDGHAAHQATGRSLHQDSLPVTTEVSPQDMNSLIWSMMDVLNDAGVAGTNFDADNPITYSRLTTAIKALISRVSIPVVPEATRVIAGYDLDTMDMASGLYTYAHGNNANGHHPAGFAAYGLMLIVKGTSFELQAIWSETQGLAFRCRFVANPWAGYPWQHIESTRSFVDQFTVGGLPSSYYPVLIAPRERTWDLAQGVGIPATYDFEVYRSDVHANGQSAGSFSLRVSCMPSRWGHLPAKLLSTNYQVGYGGGGYQAPVADVQASNYSDVCVVWLRGGATYGLRSLTPSAPVVLRAGNPAGTSQVDLNNTTYSPKTQAVLTPGNLVYGRDHNGGALGGLLPGTSWTRRSDGLIEQWGVTAVVPTDSILAVTFPVSFPNAVHNVIVSAGGAAGVTAGEGQSVGSRAHTLSGFTVVNDSLATPVFWRALGY